MSLQDERRSAQERRRFLPLLGAATRQLLDLERRWRGRPDAIKAEIERRLEACAWVTRDRANEQLVLLLRLRDLHRYVEAETEHRALKLAILEAALRQREPARRWEGVRNLLLAHLPLLLDEPADGIVGALKRDVSTVGSTLGQILRLCALLNLEAVGEYPPPAVALRFVRGRFPEHAWELRTDKDGGVPMWRPVAPLARWEYLAVDLMEYACRSPSALSAERWKRPRDPAAMTPAGVDAQQPERSERAYCRLDPLEGDAVQLPLLPVQEETLLGEVMGYARRMLGVEGMRQVALIFLSAAEAARGETFILDRARFVALCMPANPRAARECSRKLEAAVELLSGVVVDRICDETGVSDSSEPEAERIRSTRLLTILESHGGRPSQPRGARDARVERWTVLADPILWNQAGRPLGASLRSLPRGVFALSTRQHPFALALAALLARRFDEQPGKSVERSIQRLAMEAGLGYERSNPHKLAEAIKRDLHALQEAGMLGRWRVLGGKVPTLDTTLRLDPPSRWNIRSKARVTRTATKGARSRGVGGCEDAMTQHVAATTMAAMEERRSAP